MGWISGIRLDVPVWSRILWKGADYVYDGVAELGDDKVRFCNLQILLGNTVKSFDFLILALTFLPF